MAFDPGNNRADQPARLAHLDNGNQRAILVEGDEGPAQVIGLWHWRAPSRFSSDDGAISSPPAHTILIRASPPFSRVLEGVDGRAKPTAVRFTISLQSRRGDATCWDTSSRHGRT
jgi:hypothetical protein